MKFLYLFLFIFLFSFVSAGLNIGYDLDSSVDNVILNVPEVPINYSTIDTNNSQYLQGYTPLTLRTWMEDHFDLVYAPLSSLANYLPLAGGTMTGPVDYDGNNLIDVGNFTSSGTTHRFDGGAENTTVTIDSGGIRYSCLELIENNNYGFRICNDGAGSNRFVISNYDDGQEWMWIDRDEGTINFLNITEVHSNLTAEYFIGDGSGLTNLNTTLLNATLNGSFLSIDGSNAIQNIDIGLYNLTANTLFGNTANFTTLIVGNATIEDTYVPFTGSPYSVDLGANDFTVDTDTLFVNSSSGFVGIGTTTPTQKLDVTVQLIFQVEMICMLVMIY